MNRKDSILYKATNDHENSITELLCNLMREKYVRDILLLNLKIPQEIVNSINFGNISTQVSCDEGGRPDICIQNKDALIYIENKISKSTGLTPNQTSSYMKRLAKSPKKYRQMIFLIPTGYQHLHEIQQIQNQFSNDIIDVVTWEDYLFNTAKYEIGESNLVFKECFRYFEERIITKSISIKFKPEEMIAMNNPKELYAVHSLFITMNNVIKEADKIIREKLGADFSGGDWTEFQYDNEEGKYLAYKNFREHIFFGFNFNLVKSEIDKKDFLFGVAISHELLDKDRIFNLKTKMGDLMSDDDWDTGIDEWCYFKLDKYNLCEENNFECLANNIIEIIKTALL